MIEPTNIQTIYQQGVPAFVVIPFQDFVREYPQAAKFLACQKPRIPDGDAIPHEVVDLQVEKNIPLVRAWREYLGMTQNEVAARAGITQAALSQMESGEKKLRKASREKLAKAMDLNIEQVF